MPGAQEFHQPTNEFNLQNAASLERIAAIPVAEFEKQFSIPHKPVILTDAIENWPARKWTPELFASKWGGRKFNIDGHSYCLRDLIDYVLRSTDEDPAPYLRNINVGAEFTELLHDIQPVPEYCKHNRLETRLIPQRILKRGEGRYTQLFIGGAGRAFPRLHWDSPPFHTWSALLYGRKEWILFPPEDAKYLYPVTDSLDTSQISNVYNINLDKFPNLTNTHPVRIIQEPGECLFVPANWWHTAKNLEPSITIAWDQLCRSSWGDYSEYMLDIRSDNLLKRSVLSVYFELVGTTLTLFEKVGIGNV